MDICVYFYNFSFYDCTEASAPWCFHSFCPQAELRVGGKLSADTCNTCSTRCCLGIELIDFWFQSFVTLKGIAGLAQHWWDFAEHSSGANSHLVQISMLRPLQLMFIPIGWQKLFQAAITAANNAVATIWLLLSSFLMSRYP